VAVAEHLAATWVSNSSVTDVTTLAFNAADVFSLSPTRRRKQIGHNDRSRRLRPGADMRRALVIVSIAAIATSACGRLDLERRDRRGAGRMAGQRAALEARMRETFGVPGRRTPWFSNIQGVRVVGATAHVRTNIDPNVEGENFALPICDAVLDISPRRIRRVVVHGRDAVLDRCP
jgi:hypothetical protein